MKQYEENVMKSVQNSVLWSFIWLAVCSVICFISFQFIDSVNEKTASMSMVVAFFSFLFAVWNIFSCKRYSVLYRHPKKIKIYNTKVVGIEINYDSASYFLVVRGEKPNKIMKVFIMQDEKDNYVKDMPVVVAKYKGIKLVEDIEEYTGDKFTRVDC